LEVVCISAKARNGKDAMASALKYYFEKNNKRVLIYHHGDYVKYICTQYFGWNGIKDEIGRTLLQHVGTDIVRKKNPDYWVNTALAFFDIFDTEYDYVLIADCRFFNEIEKYKKSKYKTTSIRINRLNNDGTLFDNGLTGKQKQHPSEISLDEYVFDRTFDIPTGIENVNKIADYLVHTVFENRRQDAHSEA